MKRKVKRPLEAKYNHNKNVNRNTLGNKQLEIKDCHRNYLNNKVIVKTKSYFIYPIRFLL